MLVLLLLNIFNVYVYYRKYIRKYIGINIVLLFAIAIKIYSISIFKVRYLYLWPQLFLLCKKGTFYEQTGNGPKKHNI